MDPFSKKETLVSNIYIEKNNKNKSLFHNKKSEIKIVLSKSEIVLGCIFWKHVFKNKNNENSSVIFEQLLFKYASNSSKSFLS